MVETCPTCGRSFGQRRRCYYCQPGRARTGEDRICKICGQSFYVPGWAMQDARNFGTGTYCSRACKGKAESEKPRSWYRLNDPIRTKAGYITIWAPDHPRAGSRKRVMQHILIAEAMIGRYLQRGEHVHHRNGIKDDNRPENLVVLSAREHHQLHAKASGLGHHPRPAKS